MKWPTFFPCDCPPRAATPATGVVFRLVRSDPPTQLDFRAWRSEWPRRRANDECIACGASVTDTEADADALRGSVPAFEGRYIARGTLEAGDGVTTPTPSQRARTHRTWWIADDVQPAARFVVVVRGKP